MYIYMNNIVIYVGVNNMFYICTSKHVLMYKQDDEFVCMDNVYLYMTKRYMYVCMEVCMYVCM